MDTNLITILITALVNEKSQSSSNSLGPLLTAGLILLAAIAPTLVSVAAYLQAKTAKLNTEETKKTSAETAVSLEKVHVAVNSERSSMLDMIRGLREDILKLSQEKATMVEHQRGQDMIKADNCSTMTPQQMDTLVAEVKSRLAADRA